MLSKQGSSKTEHDVYSQSLIDSVAQKGESCSHAGFIWVKKKFHKDTRVLFMVFIVPFTKTGFVRAWSFDP